MRECPNCGYQDSPHWHPRIFDYEIDICRLEDLENMDPDLARELRYGYSVQKGVYAYKITKSKVVYRMHYPLFKVRGWSPKGQYYDGITSPGSAAYKRAVSKMSKLQIQQETLLSFTTVRNQNDG